MSHIYVPCPVCEEDLELAVEYEPGDSNYGADADGNRGISIPGYYSLAEDFPSVCPNEDCKHEFTVDELKGMEEKAERACVRKVEDDADRWADREADRYYDY